MAMTHTPTPWEADDDEIIAPDGDDSPWRIAVCVGDAPNSETGSENAAFIVTAVNSHDALLEAAETVLAGLKERLDDAPPNAVPVFDGIANLSDAINLARGLNDE